MKNKTQVVNAWAIVNDETGRLIIRSTGEAAIYMTRSKAKSESMDDERIIRISITEVIQY